MLTMTQLIQQKREELDQLWIDSNPFGHFVVTKPKYAYPPSRKGQPQELQAWWITERRTAARSRIESYTKDRHIGFAQNTTIYSDWDEFSRDYPDLARQLQERNPNCGKPL